MICTGEPGHFGKLTFHFTKPESWVIFIPSEEFRKDVEANAKMVVLNYDILINRMF